MGVNWNHGQAQRKFQELVTNWADDDLSERADRVVAQARTPNYGFTDRSGDLRKSIKKRKIANPRVPGYRIVAGEGALGNDGNSYAAVVEKGHPIIKMDEEGNKKMVGTASAKPYLVPALQAARD